MSNATRDAAAWLACIVLTLPAFAGEVPMVRLAGTPQEVGRLWGEINKDTISHDVEEYYVKKAAAAGISQETLIKRSQVFVRIVEEIAPHWLEEARAIARAAGVREDLYISFIANAPRDLYLHECTSYAVSRKHTQDGAIFFHKNRDNVDRQQAAYILDSSVEGVNKFIGVYNASGILCSAMVNEKGLAGCADYPAHLTRKNDPSALLPEPAEPQYRGVMNSSTLRHVAERASNCSQALKIVEGLVEKRYLAGGKVNGAHWLFVDREGTILEISSNSRHVASRFHSQKVYFSRFDDSAAAKRLREADRPVDFHLFHNVSRDPSICLHSTIAGMTVEIDPVHPELLTRAWVSLPGRSVSFPLWMGQTKTPACLLNGEVYALGKKTKGKTPLWEAVERSTHLSADLLREHVLPNTSASSTDQAVNIMDRWSQTQAGTLVELLRTLD